MEGLSLSILLRKGFYQNGEMSFLLTKKESGRLFSLSYEDHEQKKSPAKTGLWEHLLRNQQGMPTSSITSIVWLILADFDIMAMP